MMTLAQAPKDGSFMSMVVSTYMEGPYFGAPGANYDPRSFAYIGAPSTGKQRNTLVVHRSSGVTSVDDLKKKDFKFGALRVGHRSYLYGRLITDILGLKVRWVVGYSTPELYIAMERGEAHGRVNDAASMFTERREWFDKREVTPLIAMALPESLPPIDHPLFKDVPSIMQFAKTDVHKDIIKKINSTSRLGGSMALPPGTPDSIRKILSDAAQKVGNDPEFQKEWETLVLEGNKFEKMFTAEEVMESVNIYTDWQPDIIKSYKKLAHEAPKQ